MKTIGLMGGMSWESTVGYYQAVNEGVKKALGGLHSAEIVMHIVAPEIEAAIDIPVLHIADATAEVLLAEGIGTVGLLGTAFTMEKDFYKGRLAEKIGFKVLTPDEADRKIVHDVIYQELCLGWFEDDARREYLRIIDNLAREGAEAVILGCTEIGMLVKQEDTEVMLCDTTAIHAAKAVEYALKS